MGDADLWRERMFDRSDAVPGCHSEGVSKLFEGSCNQVPWGRNPRRCGEAEERLGTGMQWDGGSHFSGCQDSWPTGAEVYRFEGSREGGHGLRYGEAKAGDHEQLGEAGLRHGAGRVCQPRCLGFVCNSPKTVRT